MAGIALELAALAFLASVLMARPEDEPAPAPRPVTSPPPPPPPMEPQVQPSPEPMDFIVDASDEGARYYRAADDTVEMFAGFYSDGRVRLADAHGCFAGMLQGGRADLLELATNAWSEVFVRTSPAGKMQLELRGGPHDAHVLFCEPLRQTQDSVS